MDLSDNLEAMKKAVLWSRSQKSMATITPEDIAKIIENAYREGIFAGQHIGRVDAKNDMCLWDFSNAKKAAQDVIDYMGGE